MIVGAGAAGLSTAAALTQRGVDALVLDRSDRIGGSWASRYERLHLHTIRRFSGLAHHGIPGGRYPRYLSKDEYAAYLGEYAERFGLRIALGEEVTSIHALASGPPLWEVETARRTIAAEIVIVASGHYAEPRIPDWEGIHEFGGRLLHSAAYRTGREFVGMRALVVGLGNSGAEIATDLVEQGAGSVAVAVRTPPPIVTREMFGVVPVQLFGIALMPLGFPRTVDRIAAVLRRRTVGDLRPYGIDDAAWGPFTARRPAVIDVGFLDVLKAGRVTVRPALTRLTREGGEFADGSSGDFDVVVAATGFGTGLERTLRGVAGVVSEDGQPLSRSGQPTAADGLYFIGFDETIRGHLFEARRESTRHARRVAGSLTKPAGTSSA
ncbi:MAG TPA: NAD(P)/FAD-dependent oxidoreductase [Gaiellaceae bacterium]|nr:NAD(P)/FAD-dependent oxidoreductase [Gaiellaceae bacterium]